MAQSKGSSNPVFPQPVTERGETDQRTSAQKGLTLLDYLAIQALPVAQRRLESLEASELGQPPIRRQGTAAQVAAEAYDLAEAILTERAERLSADAAAPKA